jgi:hypothetical protein
MEKWSHRRIHDLDVLAAFQGLVSNEIGCARISMMAREQTLPSMGRIQMRETDRSPHPACTAQPAHADVHGMNALIQPLVFGLMALIASACSRRSSAWLA